MLRPRDRTAQGMSEHSAERDLAEQEHEPNTPRKKIRKGTTSCWECKRRKVRCLFTPAHLTPSRVLRSAICDGCRRRGTTCITQEFPDVPTPAPNNPKQGDDRLGRVEALVEHLLRRADIPTPPDSVKETDVADNPALTVITEPGIQRDPPVPNASLPPQPQNRPFQLTVAPLLSHKHDSISRQLLAAWPNNQDLEDILKAHDPVGSTGLLRKLASYTLHPNFCRQHVPSLAARDLLVLPPPESHPVMIARKLLLLGIFLQYLRPCVAQNRAHQSDLDERCRDLMVQVMDTTARLVTSNDELVGSVEGIECLMLESLYKDTAGCMRRSWVATRRAMTIAQMMGLHRGRAKILEPETKAHFDPQYMWFRLVQSDRYLSLMLGLPLGYSENTFATARALQGCEPGERLRRLDTVVSGRIIHRNDACQESSAQETFASTHEIDQLLQAAADAMPPHWWLVDDILATDSNGRPSLSDGDTMRIMDQIAHYNLVVQLHLPYLLRHCSEGVFDNNKMTAVNASREVLRRFTIFRKVYPVGTYCRGVDFLAFIATAALCLAHMEGQRLKSNMVPMCADSGSVSARTGSANNILGSLTHQRPTDRGLMERATESLEHMGTSNGDILATKLATLLRQLLLIEQDTASGKGGHYSADLSPEAEYCENNPGEDELDDGPSGCNGSISDGGNVLNIYIPYYGTVKIEKVHGVSRSGVRAAAGQPVLQGTPGAVDMQTTSPTALSSNNVFIFDGDNFGGHGFPSLDPEVTAGAEEWTLQGVDMAFFDSLIRGVAEGGQESDHGGSLEWQS